MASPSMPLMMKWPSYSPKLACRRWRLRSKSGSDHVLNNIIRKPLKKRLIRPAVEALRKFNVRSHVFIVIGLPGEQDEHRQETLQMLLDCGFDWVHVYLAMPIFGSRLYDICVENGYIENTNSQDFVATKSVIRAPGVDPVELEAYAYEMQIRVNFVENHNMKIGRYDVPIDYFKNVVGKYPGHAFGHYFLSECYRAIGENGWPISILCGPWKFASGTIGGAIWLRDIMCPSRARSLLAPANTLSPNATRTWRIMDKEFRVRGRIREQANCVPHLVKTDELVVR